MGNRTDMQGLRFGRLTVIKKAGPAKDGHMTWLCKCDCGKETVAKGSYIRRGITMSCGCLNKEINSAKAKKHGMTSTRLYNEWKGMKYRCYNPRSANYPNYGGRGITVCPEWRDSFEAFRDWALANGYRDDLTLDRRDNDGPYSPENCRWISLKDQQSNRRTNRTIIYNGQRKTMKQWAEDRDIPYNTLRQRLNKGWELEKALNTPVRKKARHLQRVR